MACTTAIQIPQEDGASMVEYGIIFGMIVLVVVITFPAHAETVTGLLSEPVPFPVA